MAVGDGAPVLPAALRKRLVAIGSGKGGVGKTTTAANLAVFYARMGQRVLIVDADPLSDLAVLFDLRDAAGRPRPGAESSNTIGSFVIVTVASNVDLLEPVSGKRDAPKAVGELIDLLTRWSHSVAERYDVVILDLAAGVDNRSMVRLARAARMLILVAAPEPTSHVAAGAFLRQLHDGSPADVPQVRLWLNRYAPFATPRFDPERLIRNYNRNVSDEEQLSYQLEPAILARVPWDPALDLLSAELPRPVLQALSSLEESLRVLLADYSGHRLEVQGVSERALHILRGFASRQARSVFREDSAMQDALAEYLDGVGARRSNEKQQLAGSRLAEAALPDLRTWNEDRLRRFLIQELTWLEDMRTRIANGRMREADYGALDSRLQKLLQTLERLATAKPALKNALRVPPLAMAVYRVLRMDAGQSVLLRLIPLHESSARNRRLQLHLLISGDSDYKKRYVTIVRELFALVMQELQNLAKSCGLHETVVRSGGGTLEQRVYLLLFGHIVHSMVYGGLGLITGFSFRPAAGAFEAGARDLARDLGLSLAKA